MDRPAGRPRAGRALARRAAAPLAAALLAACAALGGVRPLWGPVAGSVSEILATPPDVATRAVLEEVRREGLLPQTFAVDEGYVETQWYHLATRASSPRAPVRDFERTVRLRFFADPTAGHTRLAAEAVVVWGVDPSRPPREMERMAPEGTEGRVMLGRILDRLKRRFPLPGDSLGTPK